VFHFLEGFEAGLIPLRLDPSGILFTGGSNRGWASRGSKPFTFERVRWKGVTPFEMLTVSARKDGFVIKFTEPVDPATAGDPKSYKLKAWTYILQSSYGSPQVDASVPEVTAVKVAPDAKSVHLSVKGLVRGHVHEIAAAGVRSAKAQPLFHANA
jgi:hypothetical protein